MAKAKPVPRMRAAAQRAEQAAKIGRATGKGACPAKQEMSAQRANVTAQKTDGSAQRANVTAPRADGSAQSADVSAQRAQAHPKEPRARCAPFRTKRGLLKTLASRFETVVYHVYERAAGLSEEHPALGLRATTSLLRALGVAAPRVASSVTVSRARGEVLRALVHFEDLRRFMGSIERVRFSGCEEAATFAARAPHARGPNAAGVVSITSAPGGRSTEVKAVLAGARPAGRVARALGSLLAEEPKRRLRGDLRRLRQWIETGEIPTSAGQPSGRRAA